MTLNLLLGRPRALAGSGGYRPGTDHTRTNARASTAHRRHLWFGLASDQNRVHCRAVESPRRVTTRRKQAPIASTWYITKKNKERKGRAHLIAHSGRRRIPATIRAISFTQPLTTAMQYEKLLTMSVPQIISQSSPVLQPKSAAHKQLYESPIVPKMNSYISN
jgi:hypothetical protein